MLKCFLGQLPFLALGRSVGSMAQKMVGKLMAENKFLTQMLEVLLF